MKIFKIIRYVSVEFPEGEGWEIIKMHLIDMSKYPISAYEKFYVKAKSEEKAREIVRKIPPKGKIRNVIGEVEAGIIIEEEIHLIHEKVNI